MKKILPILYLILIIIFINTSCAYEYRGIKINNSNVLDTKLLDI